MTRARTGHKRRLLVFGLSTSKHQLDFALTFQESVLRRTSKLFYGLALVTREPKTTSNTSGCQLTIPHQVQRSFKRVNSWTENLQVTRISASASKKTSQKLILNLLSQNAVTAMTMCGNFGTMADLLRRSQASAWTSLALETARKSTCKNATQKTRLRAGNLAQ